MNGPCDITPSLLVERLRPTIDRGLFAFDVDGVLAPLVDHADDSRLVDGVLETLSELADVTTVAIVSGRSLESLERLFGFPAELHVIGSHGLEERGEIAPTLSDDERYTLEQLEIIGERGVRAAGDGAWLEHKPASVVLHTREASPEQATPAVDAVMNLARMIDGATVKPGSNVVEMLARSTTKGDALLALAERLGRRPIVYFGDDVTDEEAFAVMAADDTSVRVGPGESIAAHRLATPDDVAEVLRLLTT